jgi:flagellar hook-associated protein 3 FlgL
MRTTQAATNRILQAELNRHGNRLQELREISVTGKKISKPSDDPAVIQPVLETRSQLDNVDRYIKTMDTAIDRFQVMDAQLEQVGNLLIRAREVTISAGSSAFDQGDLNSLAEQIGALKDEMISLANTKVGSKYIFSGYKENVEPFSGNPPVYNGDTNHTMLEVGPGQMVQVNLTGNEVFTDGTNIFTVLETIESALLNGDSAAAIAQLDDLTAGADQVMRLRGMMGNNSLRTEEARKYMEEFKVETQGQLSRYEDADIIEIISELTQQESAYELALNVTAKVSQLSILDYM